MNQMDENYWKKLAEDWIKRQSQSQNIPEAPSISNYDNLAVADMELEDVKDEEPAAHNFNNQAIFAAANNVQPTNFLHLQNNQFSVNSSRFQRHENHASSKSIIQHNLVCPEPPIINTDQINTVDMEMDDSENEDSNNSNSSSALNMTELQQRHKKLPVWIREGLEKMKREKELEEARIQEELKRKQDDENRKKLMEEALHEIEREKISKSKYESSDSETEETEPPTQTQSKATVENDEEAYENMMLLVRKTLTTLLLEVTNEKIQEISNETLAKYRKKASATTKPAILKLGLDAYSSSENEDSDEENNGSNSEWESESVLKERIYQKQIAFENKMRERQKAQDMEEERMKKKSKSEPDQLVKRKSYSESDDDNKQKFKNSRKDGEEKYETMIYSISTSSGPIVRVMPREKKTRFSDPKDGRSTCQMTHIGNLGMLESAKIDNGSAASKIPAPPSILEVPPTVKKTSESPKREKKEKKKRKNSSSSTSSTSDSGHRKKHKKHKKSSKHSKKSSKKRDRSKSRSRSRERHHSSRSDRHSIESKSSMRSSESSRRHRSRSHSKNRDKHRRRY